MSDNKQYYYLKIKEGFFDSEQMIILESMPDGHLYSNILLKLYLRSLKNEGKLMFNERIPYNSTILAQIVRHPVGVVEKAIKLFKDFGLIEIMDNGAIYMLDIQSYIGKSSSEADRKRTYRARIEDEKLLLDKCPDKYPPEIELEKEIELDIEKEIDIRGNVTRTLPIVGGSKPISKNIYKEYCKDNLDLLDAFKGWEEMRKSIKKPLSDTSRKLSITALEKITKDSLEQIKIINEATLHCWQSFYELKDKLDKKQLNAEGREIDEVEIRYTV